MAWGCRTVTNPAFRDVGMYRRGVRCGERSFGPAQPVKLPEALAGVAFGHADDMAKHNYFEHQALTGRSPDAHRTLTGRSSACGGVLRKIGR